MSPSFEWKKKPINFIYRVFHRPRCGRSSTFCFSFRFFCCCLFLFFLVTKFCFFSLGRSVLFFHHRRFFVSPPHPLDLPPFWFAPLQAPPLQAPPTLSHRHTTAGKRNELREREREREKQIKFLIVFCETATHAKKERTRNGDYLQGFPPKVTWPGTDESRKRHRQAPPLFATPHPLPPGQAPPPFATHHPLPPG